MSNRNIPATRWGELVTSAWEYTHDDSPRVPTGFDTLDNLLHGGTRLGHLTFLVGRTEVGKTAVATQLAVNAARAGHPVGFASLEMVSSELVCRLLSADMGLSVREVERRLRSATPEQLARAQQRLTNITITDATKPTWDELSGWLAGHETRPHLVFIDHLKLMGRYGYPRGEAERVARISEDAKAWAKEERVSCFMLHQVGRNVEGEDKKKNHGHLPLTMEDMMYGGEQDADTVFGVYRPARDPELSPHERRALESVAVLQLLKNRHGPSLYEGVTLNWSPGTMRMVEVEHYRESPTYLAVKEAS